MDNSEEITECTLFVGDLSREVSREDLYNLFEMIGEVQEAVVKCSNVTGQPMGYGFVRMATREDAEHALQALAGMNLKGRCIRVGRAERNCRLIVKNLDRSVRFEDLLHIFLPYGSLQMYDSGQEVSVNGFCARILHFVRRADAERAKRDLHMQIFHGRPMHVEWYRHTPEDQITGEGGHTGRNEPVVSVHVRFMTIEHDVKVDEHMLYHVFKKYGEVTKISIKAMIQDKDTNLSRGYAFVHFTPNLEGCQSALEAASAMDDVMYNGVHFFSKPSQNFHRAHEELIRQENQQNLQSPQQSIPSRRFSDSLVAGRMGKSQALPMPPPPRHSQQQFLRVNNSQHYSSTGRGQMSNPSPYNSSRYYDENQKSYPRIMQYQHEPSTYPPKIPYPYQDYLSQMNEIDNGIPRGHSSWPSNGYPRLNEFNPEDNIFGHNSNNNNNNNDVIHGRNNLAQTGIPPNANLRRDGRDKINGREGIPSFNTLGMYGSQSVNEPPLWSPNQQQHIQHNQNQNHHLQQQQQHIQHNNLNNNNNNNNNNISSNQNIYSQSNHNPYPPTYSTKDIFPQEYSEQGLARYDQFQSSSTSIITSNQNQIQNQNQVTINNINRPVGRHINSAQMESGLNIEASAFLPTNNNQRPGRQLNHAMMHLPGVIQSLTDHPDLYNSNLEQNGPSKQYRSISIDNSRISTTATPQENSIPLNKEFMGKNNEDLQAGNFSDLLDRSLSSEAEHSHPHPHTHTHTQAFPVEEDNHEY